MLAYQITEKCLTCLAVCELFRILSLFFRSVQYNWELNIPESNSDLSSFSKLHTFLYKVMNYRDVICHNLFIAISYISLIIFELTEEFCASALTSAPKGTNTKQISKLWVIDLLSVSACWQMRPSRSPFSLLLKSGSLVFNRESITQKGCHGD